MPTIRRSARLASVPHAAEVLEVRTLLSASAKKTPISDTEIAGTIEIQALSQTLNGSGKATVTGVPNVGGKIKISAVITPESGPVTGPLRISGKSTVTERTQAGDIVTLKLSAKKALNIPVSVQGFNFTVSAKPKGPVTLSIRTSNGEIVNFEAVYSIAPIPGLTDSPTDVRVNLASS